MEKEKKIAMFSDSFYPIMGGRENVIDNLMRELSVKTSAFLLCPTFPGKNRFIEDDELLFKVKRCKGIRVTKNEYLSVVDRKTKAEIEEKIKSGEIELIHTQTKYALTKFAFKLRKKYNIPVITTCHTFYPLIYKIQLKFPPLYKLLVNRVKRVINKMDGVITVSEFMKNELIKMGVNRPITVIPNGNDLIKSEIDLEKNKALISEYGLEKAENIFVFVGRINPVKNLDFLFNALKMVKEKGVDFKFLLVGSGEVERYSTLAKKLGLEEQIVFTGAISSREKILNLYSLSCLHLQPSVTETFGLTIREAGSALTPSVTIKGMATSENIIEGENGFVSEASPEAFAEKIIEAIKNKDRLKEIGSRAKKDFSISWGEIADRHLEYYRQCCENIKREDK